VNDTGSLRSVGRRSSTPGHGRELSQSIASVDG
jgi:hypothetical protein